MSRKRTRSSKTSTKNLIVIHDEEVKERFDSIVKNQPMMLEKGFNLESNDKSTNVGKSILKEIHNCGRKKAESAYFPSLITSLCLKAQVKSKENLKGQYVQGCITTHDLERSYLQDMARRAFGIKCNQEGKGERLR
ncbi:hypothetical protein PVK06_047156 [Gossypium arboreum]|uniref:Uncharacterized protein n=1 Tax=Gossypium arboreum TaxID=29729 RepID=A0ABR0MF57_GOSAR|nr:hypothetical protein PVK06_047156 [Gossypium arboreum]